MKAGDAALSKILPFSRVKQDHAYLFHGIR